MQTYEMPEREIDLRCLFWKIVSRWRAALIWGLVGALLLGAFGAVKYLRSESAKSQLTEEQLTASMEKEELREVERLAVQYEGFREYEKRLEDAGILDLNPYDVIHYEILYYIDADAKTDSAHGEVVNTYNADLQNAFRRRLSSADVREEVAGILGVTKDTLSNFFWTANAGSSSFNVVILSQDEEKAQQVATYVKGVVEDYSKEIQTLIGPHSLQILGEDSVRQFESGIESLRNNSMSNRDSQEANFATKAEDMTGSQQALFKLRQEAIDEKFEKEPEEEENGSLINKKFIVLGFAAGFFVLCLWVLLKEVLGGRIQNPEDAGQFTAGYVASLPEGQKKGLDGWILKQIRGADAPASREAAMAEAVAELKAICAAQNVEQLSVLCTAGDAAVQQRAAAFAEELSKAGLPAQVNGESGAVYFYEASGKTRANALAGAVRLALLKKQAVVGAAVEF